jgi:hypothetical protein
MFVCQSITWKIFLAGEKEGSNDQTETAAIANARGKASTVHCRPIY